MIRGIIIPTFFFFSVSCCSHSQWRACSSEEHSQVVTANDCWGFSTRSCLVTFAHILISEDGNEDTRCKSAASRTHAWVDLARALSCTPSRALAYVSRAQKLIYGNKHEAAMLWESAAPPPCQCWGNAINRNLEALHQFYCDSTIIKFQLPLLCGLLPCHLAKGHAH